MLCEHYWPANPTPVTHGHITVHLLAEEPEEEWTKREFQLQHVCVCEGGWALGQRLLREDGLTSWVPWHPSCPRGSVTHLPGHSQLAETPQDLGTPGRQRPPRT